MTSPFSVEIDGRIIRVLRPGERGPAGPPGPPGPPGMGSGSYSNSNPQPLGATPAPGVTDEASRADHVHPLPSAADIGLGNVNNTTDLGKPISTATQTALDGKAAATHSHATGDITGFGAAAAAAAPVQSVAGKTGVVALVKADVGLGNVDNTTDLGKPISTATQTALDGKAAATHSHATGDITGFGAAAAAAAPVQSVAGKTGVVTLAKADVGLGNVDNTTDLNKPISTATQTALDGKAAATHSHATGDITGFSAAAAAAAPVQSVAGKTGVVTLAKADVGLGNVDNTTDLGKPISTATQTALDGKAAATHSHTAGADGSVQYKSGTVFAGATNVAISSGDLSLATSSSPTNPASGSIKPVVKPLASGGRSRLLLRSSAGSEVDALFPNLSSKTDIASASTGSLAVLGCRSANIVGTAASSSFLSNSSKVLSYVRQDYKSATTAGSVAGFYNNPGSMMTSNGAGIGGLLFSIIFGIPDVTFVPEARTFAGITVATSAPTDVSPATLTNCIGIGHEANDTTWKLYYGGSAAQTPIDLGANFPVNNTDLMQIIISSHPADALIYEYAVRRWTSTQKFETSGILGPLTATQIIDVATTVGARAWRSNGTAAAEVIMAVCERNVRHPLT